MADLIMALVVFFFSFLIGYFLISSIPPLLHTPLMSMTNAISAITILGAILLFTDEMSVLGIILGIVAIITAFFNVFGGFVITDRMVKLFKKKSNVNQL